jgi:hypothetical protein
MSDNSFEKRQYPEQCNRDWTLPTNQLHPRSNRDSGTNLDECCGDTIQESGMDEFFAKEYSSKEIK